jgi:REP element-mobilizing transposase RayT
MPRKARIDAPGAVHHIIIRGIERRQIFRDDVDRTRFLERFGQGLSDSQTACLAWALIPNHAHFLLRTGRHAIADLMRRVLTGYAVVFNRRYRRHGHLFQNRYKSILCQEDPYLKELVRYIHLNPLRAGLVKDMADLKRFPWSGHSALMGTIPRPWQGCDEVLALFGRTVSAARKHYREFVAQGIGQGRREELTGGGLRRSAGGWQAIHQARKRGQHIKGDERILGDSDFVAYVLEAAREGLEDRTHMAAAGMGFEDAVQQVAGMLGMTAGEVVQSGKQRTTVRARRLLCHFCVQHLGMSTVDLAQRLGIGQPAASRAARMGQALAREEELALSAQKA